MNILRADKASCIGFLKLVLTFFNHTPFFGGRCLVVNRELSSLKCGLTLMYCNMDDLVLVFCETHSSDILKSSNK